MAELVSGLVVVTGAAGFIGRAVTDDLAAAGHTVVAVDCQQPATPFPEGVRFHQAELRDAESLLPADVRGGDFTLVHLAWDMRREGGYALQADQVRLLARLLDHWTENGLTKLVGLGSAAEYGQRSGLIEETDPPIPPLSAYGLAKHAAWQLAQSWGKQQQRSVFWLRPFVVYGAGQRGDMAIPYAVAAAKAGQVAAFTDGLQERDFVYVTDVARAVTAAVESAASGCHAVNIGCGQPVPVRSLLSAIAARYDAERRFQFGARPRRAGEPERQVAAIGKAADLLGWSPRIPWAEGVRLLTGSDTEKTQG